MKFRETDVLAFEAAHMVHASEFDLEEGAEAHRAPGHARPAPEGATDLHGHHAARNPARQPWRQALRPTTATPYSRVVAMGQVVCASAPVPTELNSDAIGSYAPSASFHRLLPPESAPPSTQQEPIVTRTTTTKR